MKNSTIVEKYQQFQEFSNIVEIFLSLLRQSHVMSRKERRWGWGFTSAPESELRLWCVTDLGMGRVRRRTFLFVGS